MNTEAKITIEEKISKIEADVSTFVAEAQKIEVNNDEDLELATGYLANVKKRFKRIEEIRKEWVQPLNDQVKKLNNLFKSQQAPLQEVEGIIKKKLVTYQQEQERKALEARKKAEEEAKKKAEEAKKKGEEPEVKPIMTEAPKSSVRTSAGTSSFKKVWTFEIVDETKIPREFLIPDEKAIRKAVLDSAGQVSIEGVRVFQDTQVAVR